MEENMRKQEISEKIGKKIYHLRKQHKLSREKFAEMCNLSSQYIYYMEKGKFLPGCITIIDICNTFHITPSELLLDSLDLEVDPFYESIRDDFLKLSLSDRIFLQKMTKNTIELLLEKNDSKQKEC